MGAIVIRTKFDEGTESAEVATCGSLYEEVSEEKNITKNNRV